ncbi:MAG: hypothetical protein ABI847_00870 [Anaerolineales bacterium]
MLHLALPAWVRPTHPIVRNEVRHWAQSRGWRAVRYLLWGGSLTFLLVPAGCALLFTLSSQISSPAEAILALGGVFTIGLAVISTLAHWLNSLSASVLGATLIARERESQTWPFLRLTSLTSADIAGGKLVALLYTLARPLYLVLGLRLLAILSALATLLLAVAASGLTLPALQALFQPMFAELQMTAAQGLSGLFFGLAAAVLALAAWLIEPFFGVLYNGLLGLAVSTLARSSGAAIVLVFAAHFVLALGVYAPAQQVGTLLLLPLTQNIGPGGAAVLVLLAFVLPFALQIVLPVLVMVGCALFALRRVDTLSD